MDEDERKGRKQQPKGGREIDVLGHIDGPDARTRTQIEDPSGHGIGNDGGAVQNLMPGDEEELVEDVHAILLLLQSMYHQFGSSLLPGRHAEWWSWVCVCVLCVLRKGGSTTREGMVWSHLITRIHIHAPHIAMKQPPILAVGGNIGRERTGVPDMP